MYQALKSNIVYVNFITLLMANVQYLSII